MTQADMLQDRIQKALDSARKKVKDRNKDFVNIVTGDEGNGKSSLAMLMANYIDPDFDPEKQICMDHENFIRTADDLDPFQAIVFDEGIEALLSRNHGQKKNKMMIEWFREVRAKNLFIFVCMPEFKEVEKPIRDDRAHALTRTVKQGWAHFFSKKDMEAIEVDRRGNRVKAEYPDPTFRAGWKDPSGMKMWEKYNRMKRENVDNLAEKYLGGGDKKRQGTNFERKFREQRKKIAKTFVEELGMTQKDACLKLDLSKQAYTDWKNNGKLEEISVFDLSDH